VRLSKVRLSKDSTLRVRQLKGKTGLTPNVLCRIGLCVSLEDGAVPNPRQFDDGGMEFNRYTLTGDLDTELMALFRQWCVRNAVTSENEQRDLFRAHLNQGVIILHARVRGLADLLRMAHSPETA
jgi:DNA sulfur modification protein DndE